MSGRDLDADLDFDELARLAADGDRVALAALLRGLQHPMYRLALRFLGHPQDAEDATQEILIRIVTHLGSFEVTSTGSTGSPRPLPSGRSSRIAISNCSGAEWPRRRI